MSEIRSNMLKPGGSMSSTIDAALIESSFLARRHITRKAVKNREVGRMAAEQYAFWRLA